jgi:thioredoxin 1
MLHGNDTNFQEFIDQDNLVLVDFYSDHCGPCKMLAPILEEIKTIPIMKLDVSKYGDIASNFNITGIPTLIFFRSGKLLEKMVGYHHKSVIENKIKDLTT